MRRLSNDDFAAGKPKFDDLSVNCEIQSIFLGSCSEITKTHTTTTTLTMLNIILLATLALPFASAVSGTLVFTSNRAPYPDHKKGQVCADGIEPWCRRQK